ncbi:hypothetical protein HDU76_007677 [Blyttiomyces sp. JEL0837]|nr:hypothetical protein HDU76_007677 [Blyttiomyces sp. JEL0837]
MVREATNAKERVVPDQQRQFDVDRQELENRLDDDMRPRRKLRNDLDDLRAEVASLKPLAEEANMLKDERDDLRDRLRDLEDNFRNQAKSIESQQKAEMDALIQKHRQELSDAVEREKSRAARLRDDLEAEIDDLRRLEAAETSLREQILDAEQAHRQEIESHEQADKRRIFQVSREKRQEIADLKLQLETGIKTAEGEFQLKLTNESDSLKSKHTAAMDQLQARHSSEMERLRTALVTSKSQFFEERERMQETIDDLEERVRSNKQQGLEKEKEFAAKLREMDNAIDKLRYDLKASQSQAEGLKDDMDPMQAECDERVKEMESHIAEFEAMRSELESVERDYMSELSRHDAEKIQSDCALAEAKENQNQWRQQLETLQRRLDQSQLEVHEARSNAARRDPAAEKAIQAGILSECRRLSQIETLNSLQNRLQDVNVDRLGYSHASDEPPSTQKLRTEFRKMVAISTFTLYASFLYFVGLALMNLLLIYLELTQEYATQVNREVEVRSQLEAQLKQANKQRDIDLYNRHDMGTQSTLKWVTGDQPKKLHYGI